MFDNLKAVKTQLSPVLARLARVGDDRQLLGAAG